jgi:hypothetical protein
MFHHLSQVLPQLDRNTNSLTLVKVVLGVYQLNSGNLGHRHVYFLDGIVFGAIGLDNLCDWARMNKLGYFQSSHFGQKYGFLDLDTRDTQNVLLKNLGQLVSK